MEAADFHFPSGKDSVFLFMKLMNIAAPPIVVNRTQESTTSGRR